MNEDLGESCFFNKINVYCNSSSFLNKILTNESFVIKAVNPGNKSPVIITGKHFENDLFL
jgi:hypothetical protein